MPIELPLSVWPTAQQPARTQRNGRYVEISGHHPAKMLPAIAARAVATYTRPGDLVLDPMCGIGSTLVEAVHQGRDALGVEYEPEWATLARANLAYAASQGATGHGEVVCGDARHLPAVVDPAVAGLVALHAAVRDGDLVARPSFWQTTQVRKARQRGEPAHVVIHEDVLAFRKAVPDAH